LKSTLSNHWVIIFSKLKIKLPKFSSIYISVHQ
jgi:hypothetical protein